MAYSAECFAASAMSLLTDVAPPLAGGARLLRTSSTRGGGTLG